MTRRTICRPSRRSQGGCSTSLDPFKASWLACHASTLLASFPSDTTSKVLKQASLQLQWNIRCQSEAAKRLQIDFRIFKIDKNTYFQWALACLLVNVCRYREGSQVQIQSIAQCRGGKSIPWANISSLTGFEPETPKWIQREINSLGKFFQLWNLDLSLRP